MHAAASQQTPALPQATKQPSILSLVQSKRSPPANLKHERRQVALKKASSNLKAIHENQEHEANFNSDLEQVRRPAAIYPPTDFSTPEVTSNQHSPKGAGTSFDRLELLDSKLSGRSAQEDDVFGAQMPARSKSNVKIHQLSQEFIFNKERRAMGKKHVDKRQLSSQDVAKMEQVVDAGRPKPLFVLCPPEKRASAQNVLISDADEQSMLKADKCVGESNQLVSSLLTEPEVERVSSLVEPWQDRSCKHTATPHDERGLSSVGSNLNPHQREMSLLESTVRGETGPNSKLVSETRNSLNGTFDQLNGSTNNNTQSSYNRLKKLSNPIKDIIFMDQSGQIEETAENESADDVLAATSKRLHQSLLSQELEMIVQKTQIYEQTALSSIKETFQESLQTSYVSNFDF